MTLISDGGRAFIFKALHIETHLIPFIHTVQHLHHVTVISEFLDASFSAATANIIFSFCQIILIWWELGAL